MGLAGDLAPLVHQVVGSQAKILEQKKLKQSHDYEVRWVKLHQPDVQLVVKLAGPQASIHCGFERTAAILHRVSSETMTPVSSVIAVDESCEDFPWRYLIEYYIPGFNWGTASEMMSDKQRSDALAQLGEVVANLHVIKFPGFGEFDRNARVDQQSVCFSGMCNHAAAILRDHNILDFFMEAITQREELFLSGIEPGFCHEDLHKYNILLNRSGDTWHLVAILDFEKTWSGPGESDLARMELWGLTGEEFWSAYRKITIVPLGYTDRKKLYQLLWCLEVAWDTSDHLATTQKLCKDIGLPIIQSFQPFVIK